MSKQPVIREYMTPTPHTVGRKQSLAAAHKLMRDHQVRHLPVLEHGHIVGEVSQRDLLMIEALPGVNPTEVQVEDAMIEHVFTVSPDTPVARTLEGMIEKKLGSAIVCEGDRVVGVFTTIDALQAFRELLERS
jgi:acetoin utilization protein AcuB